MHGNWLENIASFRQCWNFSKLISYRQVYFIYIYGYLLLSSNVVIFHQESRNWQEFERSDISNFKRMSVSTMVTKMNVNLWEITFYKSHKLALLWKITHPRISNCYTSAIYKERCKAEKFPNPCIKAKHFVRCKIFLIF